MRLSEVSSVMDAAPLPVFALDAHAYYIYENELAEGLLGYDPIAITGKRLTDLIVYDPVLLMAGFDGLSRTGYFSGGVRYRHRNGGLVDSDVNTFRQTLTDGSSVFVALVHPVGFRIDLPEVLQTSSDHDLTGEEMRLLQLLADGFSDAQIAWLQTDDADAVEVQIQALLRKMHASSRTEAAVLAMKKRVLL